MPRIRTAIMATALATVLVSASASARIFRIGLITPPSHNWSQAAQNLAMDLKETSDQRHTLLVYPARQLGTEAQILQLLQTGALDMAILTAAEISNRVPEFGALYTPYLATDIQQAARILRGPTARELLDLLPERIGVIGLGFGMAGLRQILSAVPVTSQADLKGRKIRVTPFKPIKDFYQLAGAAPTPMPLSSVYDALANGQIDMLDMDLELILKLKYWQRSHTLVISNHMMFPAIAMISGKVWIRLSEPDRELISGLTAKHMGWVIDQAVLEEATWHRGVRDLGDQIELLEAGPELFGDTEARWEKAWISQADIIASLRRELERGADR